MAQTSTDELAILKLVARLAQAADDRDEEAYCACLASSVFSGSPDSHEAPLPSAEYAKSSIARVSRFAWTHHKLINPIVEVDGDRATARIDVVVDLYHEDGTHPARPVTIGGRYDLGLIRVDGAWHIDRRMLRKRYSIGNLDLLEP